MLRHLLRAVRVAEGCWRERSRHITHMVARTGYSLFEGMLAGRLTWEIFVVEGGWRRSCAKINGFLVMRSHLLEESEAETIGWFLSGRNAGSRTPDLFLCVSLSSRYLLLLCSFSRCQSFKKALRTGEAFLIAVEFPRFLTGWHPEIFWRDA